MLSTYTLNGVDLDNNNMGTNVLGSSKPRPGITRRAQMLTPGNRDGNTPVAMAEDSPLLTLTVHVPEGSNESFLALLDAQTLTLTHDSYSANVELLSVTQSYLGLDFTDYDCLFRFPGLFWRDASISTSAAASLLGNPLVTTVMSGLSAPVRDALIRVGGQIGNPKVTDTRGTFFQYTGSIASGSYLIFNCTTGRASLVNSNVWAGGTDVTSLITNGPSAYFMSLTPKFTDPTVRAAELTITSTSQSGAPTIEVRGYRAFRI